MSDFNSILIFLVFLSSAFFAWVLLSAVRRKAKKNEKFGAFMCLLFGGIFLYQTIYQTYKIFLYFGGADRAVIVLFPGICSGDSSAEIMADGRCFYPHAEIQPEAFDNNQLILITRSGHKWVVNSKDVVFVR